MKKTLFVLLGLFVLACAPQTQQQLTDILQDSPNISGKEDYLESPFVAAGDRVYIVGHQDGSFPPLGWHIKGEMGGIWNHPIKLMDGFEAQLITDLGVLPLENASPFTNYPYANKHTYTFENEGLLIERVQFVPDGKQGIFVQFILKNTEEDNFEGEFNFVGHSNLRPTWLGERSNMIDSKDSGSFEESHWVVKDSINPWYTVFGSDQSPLSSETLSDSLKPNGASHSLTYAVTIPAKSETTLNFSIAGSYHSKEEAISTFFDILTNHHAMATEKKLRYEQLAQQSKLTIPDKQLQETFEWLKYNCDWLVRTVPEIGTGIGAGIADYPWWFGVDSEYALKGYMAVGQDDIVEQTIQLLDSVSMVINGNGRILHEMSTNGVVFNEGNINETPQFASLIWEIYKWNGDKTFLEKYFPTIQKGLKWLLEANDADNNLFPDGFGMMEIHGLDSEMIDVASYTQRAFSDAALMALELDQPELAKEYQEVADELTEKINTEFWSETFGSYADFIGTDAQALTLIEDALVRADTLNKPWAVEELKATRQEILKTPSNKARPFVLYHNWVVNTPMEMGIADSTKAITALDNAKKFTNPFGVFVTGIDRDESAGEDEGSFQGSKVFSYTGAVMTLPTGVQAVAENNYGRPDQALDYLKRMSRSFSYALPGSIYEVSPDYGMMTQAWNIYAFAVPIVNQFFGIKPMAHQKTIIIEPQMPSGWDNASLENVKIGNNLISVWHSTSENGHQIKITQNQPDWKIRVVLPDDDYTVQEGKPQTETKNGKTVFTFTEPSMIIGKN
ncbi:MAG: glycogen debranching protein [Muricauda sp.]|jgi:glycogen debranching enzyme|nr:glycogen debranching protein [Allomuricauda sp.]MBO6587761.1 glycogen debranching protein [Allomuricauda sp.]MBO6617386.1 glycogen debranching protein [Allomuricauda sp.]MBO6643603.1 glycogen debranching protein [Allomuricauda sp.]MBO6745721.1 glycogen debranching protein [Allomuricauda sp.]MBO6843906.1 glycogen debranching protein [Allomuricauda sp.]